MNICFISTSLPSIDYGGASASTKLITEELQKRGHDVDIISLAGTEHRFVQESEHIYKIPSGTSYGVHKRIGNCISPLSHLPELTDYDIVHVYGTEALPGIIARTLFERETPPVLATVNMLAWVVMNQIRYLKQNCPEFGFRKILEYSWVQNYPLYVLPAKVGMEIVGRFLSQQADYYTVQTSGMAQLLSNSGYDSEKIDIVPNLLDERFEVTSPDPSNTIIFVGRLIERKGIQDIVDVFPTLNERLQEEWKLKIFGRGGIEAELRKKSSAAKNITINYCPYSKLPKEYRKASVMIHGSKIPESFSRTWLEAMASETAIIASKNPSSKDVLAEFAELYDPFDRNDLKYALVKVLNDRKKINDMRASGKRHIDAYRPGKVAEEYIKTYSKLV